MAKRIARAFMTVFGTAMGVAIVASVDEVMKLFNMGLKTVFSAWPLAVILIYAAAAILFGIITFFISPKLMSVIAGAVKAAETKLTEIPLSDIFFAVIGLMTGLVLALLISTLVNEMSFKWLKLLIKIVLYLVFGYLGWSIVIKRRSEINVPNWFKRGGKGSSKQTAARPKIIDTSAIIDGRILDICKTGIVEGALIVPEFVLQELRHISDSPDSTKRNRGRRGLDILNTMRTELSNPVKIDDRDFDDVAEVDAKLLRLAHMIGGVVVTNDYNLNKVASVQRVPVLNVNDLANAIKTTVIPGEEMRTTVIKEGKEANQGVAYLNDGTMIVIDGGKNHVGEELTIVVTSVLQTSAGRMIFAKLK